jgi:hypothetical protein
MKHETLHIGSPLHLQLTASKMFCSALLWMGRAHGKPQACRQTVVHLSAPIAQARCSLLRHVHSAAQLQNAQRTTASARVSVSVRRPSPRAAAGPCPAHLHERHQATWARHERQAYSAQVRWTLSLHC